MRAVFRPEMDVENLGRGPGTGGGKRFFGQSGFRSRQLTGVWIEPGQSFGRSRAQTRTVGKKGRKLPPLLQNRAPPTPASPAPLGLKAPLEEIQHQGHQSTLQFTPVLASPKLPTPLPRASSQCPPISAAGSTRRWLVSNHKSHRCSVWCFSRAVPSDGSHNLMAVVCDQVAQPTLPVSFIAIFA